LLLYLLPRHGYERIIILSLFEVISYLARRCGLKVFGLPERNNDNMEIITGLIWWLWRAALKGNDDE
jgi:hypothetical protein